MSLKNVVNEIYNDLYVYFVKTTFQFGQLPKEENTSFPINTDSFPMFFENQYFYEYFY